MGVSKKQKEQVSRVCECGCGQSFFPFPIYSNKNTRNNPGDYVGMTSERGRTLYVPRFKRSHNPQTHPKGRAAWNKGLTKEACPTLSRMGYQPGHKPYNDWSHVTERQRSDDEYRKRWLKSKKGQIPWNKGKTKTEYVNGIKSGPDHGNWAGGKRGIHDTAALKAFNKMILRRDKYTCQNCGDKNHKGRGSRCRLEVHHKVAISEDDSLAFEPSNAVTLCKKCHTKTKNYGTKLIHKRRKQGGN